MREFCLALLIYAVTKGPVDPFFIGKTAVEYYERGYITAADLADIQADLFPAGDGPEQAENEQD